MFEISNLLCKSQFYYFSNKMGGGRLCASPVRRFLWSKKSSRFSVAPKRSQSPLIIFLNCLTSLTHTQCHDPESSSAFFLTIFFFS